jgi:hypothetical protein
VTDVFYGEEGCGRVGGMNKTKVSLQASEGLVFSSASRIYAGYVASGKVTEGHEHQWMERAMRDAMQLAQMTEKLVQSDAELD